MKHSSEWSLVCYSLLFSYAVVLTACGGGGGSSSSASNITPVEPVENVAPVANNDASTVGEGGVTRINVAANDTDAEGALDLASINMVGGPSNGSPVVNTDGTIAYTHDGSETTTDSFTYTISDTSSAISNVATVNVTVTPTNDAPVAGDIAATLDEGSTTIINIAANVTDGDNALDLASLVIISGPNSGSVVDNGDGSVDYTHDGSETASDSFTYRIADISGAPSNVATVNLTITPVNDAPTISGVPASVVGEGGFYSFVPTAADADPNDTLVFRINTMPDWADFNTATGALAGAPGSVHVGTTTPGIVITVDDQQGQPNSTTSLPAFDLSVAQSFNEALFATPVVSSSTTVENKFQANDGDPLTAWVADAADSSPSIQLDFDSPKLIYRVTLSDLPASGDQVIAGLMEFSDGSSQTIAALPDNGTPQEFFFDPRQTDWIKVSLTQTTGASGLAEIAAYSALDPDQTKQAEDLFNDGNATGWTPRADGAGCEKGSFLWGVGISNINVSPESYIPEAYQQTGDCRGFSPEGVETGTYARLDGVVTTGMDLRLRLRADDIAPATWVKGAMGVLFGYQNDNNYYRLDISQAEGHRKLWKKEAGGFIELNTSPQSYTVDAWVNLRVVQHNGVILVYLNGEKVLAVEDTTFSGGQIALFCARNESCTFDNVVLLGPPGTPIVGANITDGIGHKSGEYFVDTDGTLDVAAVVTGNSGFDGVEFVIDEGLPGEISLTDFTVPYEHTFSLLPAAEHAVRTYLIDVAGQRLSDADAMAELPLVGTNGIHLVGLGDSITLGAADNVSSDDISMDGRNTGYGGYLSVLNDLLTADNLKPVTVLNEGNAGEISAEGADRVAAVVDRTPEAQGYLVLYGANDARSSLILPSGLGLDPGDPGYAGSFKDNLEQIMSAILGAGKRVFPGKAVPKLPDDARNVAIQEFNQVVDELIAEKGITGYTAPDFFAYFWANQSEMADGIHPNGQGYQSMARGWCEALSGQLGLVCTVSLF